MKKLKLVKEDWKKVLIDILTLREFAKQFWGDEIVIPEDYGMSIVSWQYHLGRLITSKDPIRQIKKYYGHISKNSR